MVSNRLIESVVRSVLLEYGGVSDDIMDLSKRILDKIVSQQDTFMLTIFKGIDIKHFFLNINGDQELKNLVYVIEVTLCFYDPDEMDYDIMYDNIGVAGIRDNSYNSYLRKLTLTLPWPSHETNKNDYMEKNLAIINHEVKHAFQKEMAGKKFVNQQYRNAIKELEGGFNDMGSPLKTLAHYYIPWIYYSLDVPEIDAFIQQMYIQARVTGDIRNTGVYKNLNEIIKDYKNLKLWYNSTDTFYTREGIKEFIDDSIRRIDEPSRYFSLCDRNVEYLIRKMRRVVGRWEEEHGNGTGSFRHYTEREIQPTTPFNTGKPYRGNSLMSKIRRNINKYRYR